MDDILKTPFFLKSLPNLESLRWSCRHFDGIFPPFKIPRKLFGSSLPRLQKLSMVNCWGLPLTDTPVLKAPSTECTAQVDHTGVSAYQLVHWLHRRQSLVSLSLTNCHIIPDANNAVSPASMKSLKEITLRNVDNGVVFRYTRCPSFGTVTTFRIAPFIQRLWSDGRSVSVTATDGSGGSVSSLVRLADESSLRMIWKS